MLHKFKSSKKYLELQSKYEALLKLNKKEQADLVFEKIAKLEKEENESNAIKLNQTINKKKENLILQQRQKVQAFLKKIDRDRIDQVSKRKRDSDTLIKKNKHVLNEVYSRQIINQKRIIQSLENLFNNIRNQNLI